ncbi:hypothetical protein N7481_012069, partial [Penicillium waksmanii]|uniref:uncharacterized protein n=1 Tax=Penicillium waksmanii TaxID=69791 RepID=UPI00254726FF
KDGRGSVKCLTGASTSNYAQRTYQWNPWVLNVDRCSVLHGNVDDALNKDTGYPYIEIFYQETDSMPGTLTMCSIILIIGVFAATGMLAATSHQFWSFARDRGVPGWRLWSQVSSTKRLPVNATLLTGSVACLLGLINIGSSVALDHVLSMAVQFPGYIFHISRSDHSFFIVDAKDTYPGAKLVWGSFHVPGMWGIMINGYAVMYMTIAIFFSLWPTERAVTAESMDYGVVGTVGTIILALVYYALRARKVYRGPVVVVPAGLYFWWLG